MDYLLIVYAGVFATVLLVVDTLMRLVFSRSSRNRDVANRIQQLRAKEGSDQAYSQLLLRRGVGSGSAASWRKRFADFYTQTGLEMGRSRQVLYLVAFFFLGFVLSATFISGDPVIAIPLALVFMGGLTFIVLRVLRNRRIKKFTSQMAPAIDIIVRSLNAGHPLNSAIALVSREMPDPIGSEFGILSDQMTFGLDLDSAMLNMIERVGAEELNLLAVTVSVQRGTGGNMSEILENLAKMIRDRLMIKAKIKAISAEGRATMWIMLSWPFLLYFMLLAMVPTYFDPVWESGYGGITVGICLTLMLFGGLVIRRLVNFDF